MGAVLLCGETMKKKTKKSGSIKEQLVIPGLEVILSSVDSAGSQRALGNYTYDETWGLTKQRV